jgi:transcriptional regulator with PAS, ATPase and Fis domain
MIDNFLRNPQFLPGVFETMSDGLMVIDNEGYIQLFNRAAEEITGYKKQHVIGKKCSLFDCNACVVLNGTGNHGDPQLIKFGAVFNKECTIKSGDGRSVRLLKNAIVVRDPNGEIIGTVETMTDITSSYRKGMGLREITQDLRQEYCFMGLLGKSAPMQRLYEHIRNASQSEAPTLILGESGSGKNLVARALHKLSRRKEGPFIQMNCASLNEQLLESELFGHKKGAFTGAVSDRIGRFEASNKGTIFLDEIGDMPLTMQVKLLRVLEEKVVERVGDHKPIPVNIRTVSATNKDPGNLMTTGKFREDLLYRINSVTIQVPPLRERREDIPLLAFHYLKKISAANNKEIRSISPPAMEILIDFPWPGNVRRLINALEHSAVACKNDTIEVSDLPDYLVHERMPEVSKGQTDREKISSALAKCNGNRTLAAKQLGISRVTLWKKIKALGME